MAVAALLAALVLFGQRRLIYLPNGGHISPFSAGLADVTEVRLPVRGAEVVLWRAPALAGKPTLVYFHGNGGGLADRADRVALARSEGWGIAMLSWRGYSGGTGSPSEAANVADALVVYDRVVAEGVAPADIVLMGESLGTGVAVQVATRRSVAALVLDSPFTSLVDVAAYHFPMLPVGLLLWDRYNSLAVIGKVRAPLLVLHGDDDEVVPFALGLRLFAAATATPKRHVPFPHEGHLVSFSQGGWAAIKAFVAEVRNGR